MMHRLLPLLCVFIAASPHPAEAADRVALSGEVLAEGATREGVFVSNRVLRTAGEAMQISNRSIPFGLPDHEHGSRYGRAAYRLPEPAAVPNDPDLPGDAVIRVHLRRGKNDTAQHIDVELITDEPAAVHRYRFRTQDAPTDRFTTVSVDLDGVHNGLPPGGDTLIIDELRIATTTNASRITQLDIASIEVTASAATPPATAATALARLNVETYEASGQLYGAALRPGVVKHTDGYLALDNGSVPQNKPMKKEGGPRFSRIDLTLDPPVAVENDPNKPGDAVLEVDYRRGSADKAGRFLIRMIDDDGGSRQGFAYLVDAKAHDVAAGDKAFATVRIDLDDVNHGDPLPQMDLGLVGLSVFTPWLNNDRTQIDIRDVRVMRPGDAPPAPSPAAAVPPPPRAEVPAVARLSPETFRTDGVRFGAALKPGVVKSRGDYLTLDNGGVPLDKPMIDEGGPRFSRIDAEVIPPRTVTNNPRARGDAFIEVEFRCGPDNENPVFYVRLVDDDNGKLEGFAYRVNAQDLGARNGDNVFTTVRIDLDNVDHGSNLAGMDLGLTRISVFTPWLNDARTQIDLRDIRVMQGSPQAVPVKPGGPAEPALVEPE